MVTEALKTAGMKFWKMTKIILLIILLLTITYMAFMLFANYSEGSRTGYVTKISHKGVLFKTYEGELNFGFFGGSANNGKPAENAWNFSVIDSKVAEQVEKASKAGHKVTLFYKQKYWKVSLRGDSEYLVYKVEADSNSVNNPALQNQ
jgi:uncharacterized protein YpmS